MAKTAPIPPATVSANTGSPKMGNTKALMMKKRSLPNKNSKSGGPSPPRPPFVMSRYGFPGAPEFCVECTPTDSLKGGSGAPSLMMSGNGGLSFYRPRPAAPQTWKDRLLSFSNYASLFCVLDCTVLPVVMLLLPLFGMFGSSATWMAHSEFLHELGHKIALRFVLPVGALATTTNYMFKHNKVWIASIAVVGLMLIATANGGCSLAHSVEDLLPHPYGHVAHEILHSISHGLVHRLVNLSGCAMLMLSNYLSSRQVTKSGMPACGMWNCFAC